MTATLSFPKYRGAAGPGSNLPETFEVRGRFTLATPPVIVAGKGFSVSRTSQGIYRVTLNQKVGRITGATGTLICPASTTEARFCRGILTPVDANNYVEFLITDAAGAVQDPVGLDLLYFVIDTTLTRQGGTI